MGMRCTKHNFHGDYQCEQCELEIHDKIGRNELTTEDFRIVQEVHFWIQKRIADTLYS